MRIRLGLSVGERLSIDEMLEHSLFCDEAGFDSIWVAEGRLTRDAITPAAILAHRTRNVRIATGVINHKTRNPVLTAVTFKTLNEVAPDRITLGIGPWWEPLASRVGTPLQKPLKEMREYVAILRTMFANETVQFDGEFQNVHDVRFDMMYRENRPVPVPVYLGAVGPKMLELGGEISDGILLDFHVPVSYNRHAVECVERGLARRNDGVTQIDLPQLVSCSVDDDEPQAAIDACKAFLTMYLAQQPHISTHSGVDPELIAAIKEVARWPATPAEIENAMALVSNELAQSLTACGTTAMAMEQIEAYLDAGATCAVLCTLGDKTRTTQALAKAAA